MKMILAIIQADDANAVLRGLAASQIRATRIATEGGWLRRANATILSGVEDLQVETVLKVLQQHAHRRISYTPVAGEQGVTLPHNSSMGTTMMEIEVGGATVFILDVARFSRISD